MLSNKKSAYVLIAVVVILIAALYTESISIQNPYSEAAITYDVNYDLNNDGVLNQYDVNAIGNVVFGTSQCPNGKNCDFNKDGAVSVFDILEFDKIKLMRDLNGDGVVNRYDHNVLANVIAGTSPCPKGKLCDINTDGSVNVFDLTVWRLN